MLCRKLSFPSIREIVFRIKFSDKLSTKRQYFDNKIMKAICNSVIVSFASEERKKKWGGVCVGEGEEGGGNDDHKRHL